MHIKFIFQLVLDAMWVFPPPACLIAACKDSFLSCSVARDTSHLSDVKPGQETHNVNTLIFELRLRY